MLVAMPLPRYSSGVYERVTFSSFPFFSQFISALSVSVSFIKNVYPSRSIFMLFSRQLIFINID